MKYTAKLYWEKKSSESFIDNKYSRQHKWIFDGGMELTASSSPQVVPVPMSDENAIDPEESFVASVASCHMLFFLSIAASHRYVVENYQDHVEGIMSKNDEGKMAMTEITLKPKVIFSGNYIPSEEEINKLHMVAHEKCYIANSIKTAIKIISQ